MSFRTVILWILLALLPLRGWAMSDMQVNMAAGELAVAASAFSLEPASKTPQHVAMPCHGDAAQPDSGSSTEPGQSPSGGHSSCALCDLCHSVAMTANTPNSLGLSTDGSARLRFLSANTGRALVGGLDRPPRSALLS